MLTFRVVVHGRHFQVVVESRRFFFFKKYSSQLVGFYTTRFVEADSANDAIRMVLCNLRTEMERAGRTTDRSIMEVEEVREDAAGLESYGPGGGYTFYSEE